MGDMRMLVSVAETRVPGTCVMVAIHVMRANGVRAIWFRVMGMALGPAVLAHNRLNYGMVPRLSGMVVPADSCWFFHA
jgi:hypothetical protein